MWELFCYPLHITLHSPSNTQSHPNLIVPALSSMMGLCDDMVLWSIRGIPAWEIYGPASLLAILTTPTPFNLTAVIHCHCLTTMALANCQLTHRHYVFVCVCMCVCVRACLRAWMWDCWNTAPLCSTVAYSMSVKCRPEVTGRSAALVTIRNL